MIEFFEQLVLEFGPLIMVYSCWTAVPQDIVIVNLRADLLVVAVGLGETGERINYDPDVFVPSRALFQLEEVNGDEFKWSSCDCDNHRSSLR